MVLTTGKIPEADICFLDEAFKCNDGVLNSLLTALNERKYTNEGRTYKNKAGETETDFLDVVVWRKLGETVTKYFTKGRMAVVSGRLQVRPWTDQEGNKRYSTEIVADHVYFGDSRPKAQEGDASQPPEDFVPDFSDLDGELPL